MVAMVTIITEKLRTQTLDDVQADSIPVPVPQVNTELYIYLFFFNCQMWEIVNSVYLQYKFIQ